MIARTFVLVMALAISSAAQGIRVLPTDCCDNTPDPPAPVTLTADQVFSTSMIGQTWTFVDGYGNHLWIQVQAPPQSVIAGWSGTNLVLHYTKSSCAAYWSPTTCQAELFFVLHRIDASDVSSGIVADVGSWVSIASLINMPQGCGWCSGPGVMTADVRASNGSKQGYLIIPASGDNQSANQWITNYFAVSDTTRLTYDLVPGTAGPISWRTDASVDYASTPRYTGNALVSEQWENCSTATWTGIGCAHERWYFCPGLGLCQIWDINNGGPTLDTNLIMRRVS